MSDMQELTKFRDYLSLRVQPGTVNVYMNALQMWFASNNGDSQTTAAAQSYIDSLAKDGKAPSTISTRAHAIMRYFRWKGVDIHLDCPTIRMKEPEYLSMQELEKVLATCTSQLEKTLVVVLFDTAVRISEFLNLKLEDVDWDRKLISVVRKGGKLDEVNISEKALGELEQWIKLRKSKSEKILMDLDYYSVWIIVKRIGRRAGIKLHPHIFRHSRAIHLLRNKVPINIVSQHLGHKSITTTINIYGRFTAADFKEQITPW